MSAVAFVTTSVPAFAQPFGPGGVENGLGEAPEESTSERYRRGIASFDYGDCAGALTALEPIAVPGILDDQGQLLEAYRILGVCTFQAGRVEDAVRFLEALLYIDPAYQLDPFRTPPPVSELFEERKAVIQQKLEQIEEERRRQEAARAPVGALLIERERVVRATPFATVFLPFGTAQALNGEGGKALLIGGLQGLTLATNLAATLTAFSVDLSDGKVGSRPHDDVMQGQVFAVAWATSAIAFVGFVGSYVYGVADAWWNRVPEEEVSRTERQQRLEGDEAKRLFRRLGDE